jgi:CobQ-like glutamine amidotransferase family enzyme
MSSAKTPLTVVYDGSRLSTRIEVEKIKQKDTAHVITLVDIAAGGKAEDYGCETAAVRKAVHVRDADGAVTSGIGTLQIVYGAVGLGDYFRFCRAPGLTSGGSFKKAA